VTQHGAGAIVEPFVITPGSADLPKGSSLKNPLPTVMTQDRFGVVSPFVLAPLGRGRGNAPRPASKPLPTILASRGGGHLVEPFIIQTLHGKNDRRTRSIGIPLSTITSADAWALVEPFILQQQSGGVPRSTKKPLPTIAGKGAQAIVTPFIVEASHKGGVDRRVHSNGSPLPTQPCSNRMGVVQPFILPQNSSNRPRSARKPVPTLTTTSRGVGVVQPYLVKYYSSGDGKVGHSVESPIGTVTAKDRFALVIPGVGTFGLDIRFRMLNTRELARAMGFEKYVFTGTRAEQTKMIGNAVEVNQARALCRAMLEGR
jgi:DNA (cytosine-5)-methyltransferase 1